MSNQINSISLDDAGTAVFLASLRASLSLCAFSNEAIVSALNKAYSVGEQGAETTPFYLNAVYSENGQLYGSETFNVKSDESPYNYGVIEVLNVRWHGLNHFGETEVVNKRTDTIYGFDVTGFAEAAGIVAIQLKNEAQHGTLTPIGKEALKAIQAMQDCAKALTAEDEEAITIFDELDDTSGMTEMPGHGPRDFLGTAASVIELQQFLEQRGIELEKANPGTPSRPPFVATAFYQLAYAFDCKWPEIQEAVAPVNAE